MNKHSTIIQMGFCAYIGENWITGNDPGLKLRLKHFTNDLYLVMGTKIKNSNPLHRGKFKPGVVKLITEASNYIGGRYQLNDPLVLGTIQTILINCYEISGFEMKRKIKPLQDIIKDCIDISGGSYFDNNNNKVFIEISGYLNKVCGIKD